MTCVQTRSLLHDYLDRDLELSREAEVEAHLLHCDHCRPYFDEFEALRKALAQPMRMPQAMRNPLWGRLRRKGLPDFSGRVRSTWRDLWLFLGEINLSMVYVRAAALAISFAAFAIIFHHIYPSHTMSLRYPVFTADGRQAVPLVSVVDGQESLLSYPEMDKSLAAIPHNDEVTAIVNVDSAGHLEIGDILSGPKNLNMIKALGQSIRAVRLDPEGRNGSRRMITTLHRVEVYSGAENGM